MKKLLYLVSFVICSMLLSFVPQISVFAVGDTWSSAQSYTYFENHFDDINTRLNGVIINQNNLERDFEDFLEEYRDNYNIPNGTSETTWIGDNISGSYQNGDTGVSDIGISQSLRQAMRDWCNAYLEANTGYYYGYTYNSSMYLSKFGNNQAQYHAFLDLLSDNEDKTIVTISLYGVNSVFIFSDNPILYVADSYSTSYNVYNTYCYYNWNNNSLSAEWYQYDTTNEVYTKSSDTTLDRRLFNTRASLNTTYIGDNNIVSFNTKQIMLYKSYQAMQNGSEGIQDYYVTDSYNSSISGSYNTTTSNIENTIGSNNVNNYINNYYVENGKYPSTQDINIYITNNINGGGNNNGGGDDTGGGSNWDFSFLGTIGSFLSELISGLGEIIGGILSALTSIITSFREGFPNVIGSLLEYFLPFLPEEIITLISLSILFAIILGIVKIIRG